MPKEIVEVDQHVNHFLPLIAFGWTVIAFLLGHFMGHRSAINRDKRKEFNETVEPLLEYYEEYFIQLRESGYYSTTEFPILAVGKIARRLSRRRRKKFNRVVNDIITLGKLNNENEKHILIIKVKEICNLISLK
ncbi:MAG: hypothetical protein ACMX3H_10455 [Sodalis sp. (in: enterobacteria)]|uniref:hypothetical protein n=1 Tax=Sodalis sp. (in: enterobacteria) TaxID=1898979 RepID=UPI0039E3BC4E